MGLESMAEAECPAPAHPLPSRENVLPSTIFQLLVCTKWEITRFITLSYLKGGAGINESSPGFSSCSGKAVCVILEGPTESEQSSLTRTHRAIAFSKSNVCSCNSRPDGAEGKDTSTQNATSQMTASLVNLISLTIEI